MGVEPADGEPEPPVGEPPAEEPAGGDTAGEDVTGTGRTDTTGTVIVTVGDAGLHAVQTTAVVMKPAGTPEVVAGVGLAPGAVTNVVVYEIVV